MSGLNEKAKTAIGFFDGVTFFGGLVLALQFDLTSGFFWIATVITAGGLTRFEHQNRIYNFESDAV